jgi:hypothetical protein
MKAIFIFLEFLYLSHPQTDAKKSTQKEQNDVDARQKQQEPKASNAASNSTALQRSMATAVVAGTAASPLGPLVAGVSALGGFVTGYLSSD